MPFLAVMSYVAGLVRWDGFFAAFTFGCGMVIVQVAGAYASIAEIARHRDSLFLVEICGFEGTALRLEHWQKCKRLRE